MIIRPFVLKFTQRHWLVAAVLVALFVLVSFLYLTAPFRALVEAKARWLAQGYSDYRIVVKYSLPLYECEQDFEVRTGNISYRHKDECRISPIAGNNNGVLGALVVASLFQRIEDNFNMPPCGPNGCLCDGPLGTDVMYHSALGYPEQITYRLMPELRWRYPEYWVARLTGRLNCPSSSKNTLGGDAGPVITIISLTPLKPEKPAGGGLDGLPLATPTPIPGS